MIYGHLCNDINKYFIDLCIMQYEGWNLTLKSRIDKMELSFLFTREANSLYFIQAAQWVNVHDWLNSIPVRLAFQQKYDEKASWN